MISQTARVSRRPILVTGLHRSGSTWVGRMLAEAPGMFYIHEPFSVTDGPGRGICNVEFKYWFTHVTQENEADFYQPIKNMIAFHYNLAAALSSVRSVPDLHRVSIEYRQFLKGWFQGSTPLIKDPIAFFSAEWLAERFNMAVVMVIRHPAAFVSSIKKLNWSHPFTHFLEQPSLLQNLLQPFEGEIREYAAKEQDIVDQAILLWRLCHYTMMRYQKAHKDWIFVRHEDLSQDSVREFAGLFKLLNLEFSDHVQVTIKTYSNSANPAEVDTPVGSESSLKRNSRSNIWNWKHRLTSTEIKKIRLKVDDIASSFYSDEDW